MTVREVATKQRVSKSLVSKVLQLYYRKYGTVNNPFSSGRERKTVLDKGNMNCIQSILEANPGLYLDELQAKYLST
ncbi:hypothetical protein FIBSPDRAFT_861546 [Athelia psychrophila]|uniref:Paired domain-containing protein n=1 Tax=Athelia psychrophila TaxID=1759441 RepID=A0A166J6H9_9AGAM|nr:hypothetical protein FIBSPDRAFT_861546 [Fibularhizoctonia sp. CBS 109695]